MPPHGHVLVATGSGCQLQQSDNSLKSTSTLIDLRPPTLVRSPRLRCVHRSADRSSRMPFSECKYLPGQLPPPLPLRWPLSTFFSYRFSETYGEMDPERKWDIYPLLRRRQESCEYGRREGRGGLGVGVFLQNIPDTVGCSYLYILRAYTYTRRSH